ncbi:MAG: GFA family protein [Mariprofundales bacterium]
MSVNKGKCFCGEVIFNLTTKIMNVVNCNCNLCRSHSGAAFSTYAALPYTSLQIIKGHDSLRSYQMNEGKKHFCNNCGTPIFNLNNKYPSACMIYIGTLEDLSDVTPKMNVWCESKLGWIDTMSSISSFTQGFKRK